MLESDQKSQVYHVVYSFYEKATSDILIGFHFRNIPNFLDHIPRIASFWEVQLLGNTSYDISPAFQLLKVHEPLKFNRGQLKRWLKIFRDNLAENKIDKSLERKWLKKLTEFEKIFLEYPLFFKG